MKIFYKRILSKNGFTLVELLVVLIVSSILILCATGMMMPVRNLLNTSKSNAHMDTACDTINEYVRKSVEKADAIGVVLFPDENIEDWSTEWVYVDNANKMIRKAYADFSQNYKASDGYQIRALGIMQNYNKDFRLFDFGDVTTIDYSWGHNPADPLIIKSAGESNDPDDTVGTPKGNAFQVLLEDRDGGGRGNKGWNGDEFGWFSAFNDPFYSNGIGGEYNYSVQVAFETNGSYFTINTQMFQRKGDIYGGTITSGREITYNPANQMKTLSFKLLNGSAELYTYEIDTSSGSRKAVRSTSPVTSINTVETINGAKQIKNTSYDDGEYKNGVVIIYAVRDIDAYFASIP